MTGSVIGGIGRSAAAAPTPGTTSMTDGSEAGGSCMAGTSGRPDGTSTAPPPPPPPGAGRPTPLVEVDVVVSLVSLDVVLLVVVSLVVVRVVVLVLVDVDVEVSVAVVDGDELGGGGVSEPPPPQPCAFPLLPSLPQLPLSGLPPLPGLSVSVFGLPVSVPGFSSVFVAEPSLPSGSVFGPLPGSPLFGGPPGASGDADGSARANAPPRPHRNSPAATRQADAAPCTREPTSSPPFKASTAGYSMIRQFWHNHGKRFCCGFECTPTRARRYR